MEVRVRAIAITVDGKLVVIRRERIGRPEYRVFPGGGVQPTDRDGVSALIRELREEISGEATVQQPVYITELTSTSGELRKEIFYACHLQSFSLEGGPGPEWKHPDPNNRYFVETIEMGEASLRSAGLLPSDLVEMLVATPNPFDLPTIDDSARAP